MAEIDITGSRFGKLLAVRKTSHRSGVAYLWEFICDCGNTCERVPSSLRRHLREYKTPPSCGCGKRGKGDYKGMKFGMLTCLRKLEKKASGGTCYLYLWRCDCGNEVERLPRSVKYRHKKGKVANCGCLLPINETVLGNQYGDLTVVREIKEHGVEVHCECICKCGGTITTRKSSLKNGHAKSCGCSTKGVPKLNNRLSTEEFVEKAIAVHGDTYDYQSSEYETSHTKLLVTCKLHGDFKIKPNCHLRGTGCPKCNESHGERRIRMWLEAHGVAYSRQRKFDDCVDKKRLAFDFHLPEHDLLIEFQGEQHYRPVKKFGGEKAFKSRVRRDGIKRDFARENGLRLLEIPHTKKNQIEEILGECVGVSA